MPSRPHRPTGESEGAQTAASFSGPIKQVGSGLMYAVVILIVLGAFYNTAVVAEPWANAQPTDRVNETHTATTGTLVDLNQSADWYYDNSTNYAKEEVVTNQTTGTQLTEGTDYEFYSNGTVEIISSDATEIYVEYSYYQLNTWETLFTTFASYGETAFIMIGVGFIALGAAVALRYMGAFGSSGGR